MDRNGEMVLTADQQIARLTEDFPGFRVVHATPWILLWRGTLRPFACTYDVQVLLSAISLKVAGIGRNTPHVEVLHPLITRRSQAPDQPIPHTWANDVLPHRPRLCLYRDDEWTPALSIAETIIPWTIEWLAAYECWRATGEWSAGGHGTERNAPASAKHRAKGNSA